MFYGSYYISQKKYLNTLKVNIPVFPDIGINEFMRKCSIKLFEKILGSVTPRYMTVFMKIIVRPVNTEKLSEKKRCNLF